LVVDWILTASLLLSGFLCITLPTIFNSLSKGKIELKSYDKNIQSIIKQILCLLDFSNPTHSIHTFLSQYINNKTLQHKNFSNSIMPIKIKNQLHCDNNHYS